MTVTTTATATPPATASISTICAIEIRGGTDDGRIAVIEIIRTGYDESGQPFRVTITTYPADRNQFVMTAGEVPMKPPEPDEAGEAPVTR